MEALPPLIYLPLPLPLLWKEVFELELFEPEPFESELFDSVRCSSAYGLQYVSGSVKKSLVASILRNASIWISIRSGQLASSRWAHVCKDSRAVALRFCLLLQLPSSGLTKTSWSWHLDPHWRQYVNFPPTRKVQQMAIYARRRALDLVTHYLYIVI